MSIRKIITIDENLCNGCGLCVNACHEAAIIIEGGKARLLRDNYCDGLGNCLPACPTNAISFIEREAAEFDEKAVHERLQDIRHTKANPNVNTQSRLTNWPVQIKLAPVKAPYFANANLLIAADCAPFAFGDFHETFLAGKTLLIGCPKLDTCDYSEKLAAIIANNDIASITIVRMEVPCCGGLVYATQKAIEESRKNIATKCITISVKGKIIGS